MATPPAAHRLDDFTQGSMASNLLRLALPMTTALLINVLYSMVDRIYIGHIPLTGRDALTGIGLAFPIIAIISAFYALCATGGASAFAIARGRGDDEDAGRIQGNSFALLLFFSVLLLIGGQLFKGPLLRLVGASESTFFYADAYLSVYLWGTPFVLISLGMNPFINAQGHARTGMLSVLIGALVNIILDPLFIYTLDMGVAGAALASIIAQGCSTAWVLFFLCGRHAPVRLTAAQTKPVPATIGQILSLGVSGFTIQVTNSAVVMVFNIQLAAYGGDIWVSAMTIVNTLRELTFMFVSGVTTAVRPLLGYNYGAGCYGRVKEGIKLAVKICLSYNVFIWAMLMAFPQLFVRLFSNDPALLSVGCEGIRLFFCMFFMMTLMMVGQSTFVGLGLSKHAMFFSLLRKVVLAIPFALLLPRIPALGVRGVFLSEPLSETIGGLICFSTMLLTVWRDLTRREKAATEAAARE